MLIFSRLQSSEAQSNFVILIVSQPPPTNGKSLEQLIREFKDMEKIRHDALQVVLNKPEYKEDENMVKYMATLTELDRVLVDTRKAIKDVPSILNPTEISTDMVDSKGVLDTLRRLRSESEILKVRLTEEGKAVSVDVLGDNEVQMLMASFGVSGKKLVEIGLKMLMEIFTAQSYMRGMSYNNSPSVSTSYKNGLSVPVANNVY
ncbi:uncharacterized protein [Bemisia tabaci]|uniref:uncharacterized protein n=1 Tax=Bemisia tabaci TaxID=7038 RepID=UPI003B28826B